MMCNSCGNHATHADWPILLLNGHPIPTEIENDINVVNNN